MIFLFLFLIFAIVTAALWFQGLWSAAVTLVNLLLAMMIATTFFEPVSTALEGAGAGSWTYLLDFVVLWLLFAITFGVLRAVSDALSKAQVKFDLPVEMAGRSLLAAWCGWLMVGFVAFSLQMAPLNNVNPLGAFSTPIAKTFLFASPDRLWLGFMHSRSRGALSRAHSSDRPAHPADQELNVETFDPEGEFPLKYHDRRDKYAKAPEMRVSK